MFFFFFFFFFPAIPTVAPPSQDSVGTTEVNIPFKIKETLSSGKPVRLVLQGDSSLFCRVWYFNLCKLPSMLERCSVATKNALQSYIIG